MAEKELKARGKNVQKMTKDGLVEINLADKTSKRVSERGEDVRLTRTRKPDSESPTEKTQKAVSSDLEPRLTKHRGETNKIKGGASKKPRQKHRLRFQEEEENRKPDANEKVRDNLSRGGESGSHSEKASPEQKTILQKKVQVRKYYYEKSDPSGRRPKVFFDKNEEPANSMTEDEIPAPEITGKELLQEKGSINGTDPTGQKSAGKIPAGRRRYYHAVRGAGRKLIIAHHISGKLRHKAEEDSDDNSAVDAASKTQDAAENAILFQERKRSRQMREASIRKQGLEEPVTRKDAFKANKRGVRENEHRQNVGALSRYLQKQQIKRDYAKAKYVQENGTATVGTIEYIKKIGGKVTDFFKENRKVFVGIGVIFLIMMLISTSVTSCGAMFAQNIAAYAGSSYLSNDEEIYAAELYYTQMEAELQDRINRIRQENEGHEEYRYNISPIYHDPFVLISYLSAKYEVFTFEQIKTELEELFALQYQLETEAVNETVRETVTVRVGESLGQVVTSGYCNCSICCGSYAGGPTASGVMPVEAHTIAVDSRDPLVPMGTKIIMNGTEYVVEDTGPLNRYGVNFDVYYDDHDVAEAHGHQTWEAYIADDNGGTEVEVTRVRQVDAFNVTLTNNGLKGICEQRLTDEQKVYYDDYNEVKGNLQMFGKPVDFNWFNRVTGYYGYRVDPLTGNTENHNGIDIFVFAGTEILSGLDGTVSETGYNDSYGNYIYLTDSYGYEVRYANLASISVVPGSTVTIGEVIGTAGTDNFMSSHLHLELLYHGERMNPVFYFEAGEAVYPDIPVNSSGAVAALLAEALSHLGTPYVWGGYDPSGFDCSGFASWCLVHSGARNTGRLTAQELYDICVPISEAEAQPGDLIFFTGTYDSDGPVSHIGIYLGNGQMVHSGHPNQIASIYSPFWISHFYGFGRW